MAVAKKKKKQGRKKKQKQRAWKKIIAFGGFFFILGGLVVFMMLKSDNLITPAGNDDAGGDEPPIQYEEPLAPIAPEIIAKQGIKEKLSPAKEGFAEKKERPSIAIVIDDMGYNRKICEALLALDLNLSFAILPFGPYTEQQADRAKRLGRDVLLHFPMEATNPKWQPDGNTVTINMDRAEIGKIFAGNLNNVPGVIGINNHMGSRFTRNSEAMRDFMELVRKQGLFFLDSRTSRNSVGEAVAAKMGVKTAKRDVFLDNVRDPQAVIVQLRKVLDLAERDGRAIAIGHPYPETLKALKMLRREIQQRVRVVGVGELVG
jgi:hypothetical protein